ncbi:MAG: hypothetical protein MZV70_63575 [Desulfobacterales bacterium]|nr:hypothetical protein [Desulfobacterales bacterium]
MRYQYLLYLPGAGLLWLLVFTDTLVLGFRPFQDTVLREPGPWYFLFETYLEVYLWRRSPTSPTARGPRVTRQSPGCATACGCWRSFRPPCCSCT